MKQTIDIAAYVWPSYSGDDPRTLTFWQEGMGEWQTVRDAKPKFDGHIEPRKPCWGFVNEASPDVMEMQINAAVRRGVNVFIYDWYWYDNRPFLENCLNDGFLGAPNNGDMKFYLMWANHDVNNLWDKRNSHRENDTLIWSGAVDRVRFENACERIIERYFSRPNYYRIDGKPVLSIFHLSNLVNGLGGEARAQDALAWFDRRCAEAGFGGVHWQLSIWGASDIKQARALGFSSVTNYQFCQMTNIDRAYADIIKDIEELWGDYNTHGLPYIPHVSVGWDNNARFVGFMPGIIKENTPEQIEAAFRAAKAFLEKRPELPRLITVNSWNEWTEGSYLQPDAQYGYGYLEAIRRVFLQE